MITRKFVLLLFVLVCLLFKGFFVLSFVLYQLIVGPSSASSQISSESK